MIEYTNKNIEWLRERYQDLPSMIGQTGDATSYEWDKPNDKQVDFVACESYLGRPFTSYPTNEVLNQTVSECNTIIKKSLINLHKQLKSGTRLCIAVPAWNVAQDTFKHLPFLDSLENLGYNRLSFEHVINEDLCYFREDQFVARELLVLTRK